MSTDPRDRTGDIDPLDAEIDSPFSEGVRVGVVQMGVVSGRLGTHHMGHGALIAPPQIGALLQLRIRGARGFASSRIQALRAPLRGYLLVATERSVYLVALPECLNQPHPRAVTDAAIAMVEAIRADAATAQEVTQYVRLEIDDGGKGSVLPRGPVFASVERAGESASKEALGQCDLLSAVVPGSPLRLATADGRVIATSDVTSISQTAPGEFCVSTGNSIYSLAPVVAVEV